MKVTQKMPSPSGVPASGSAGGGTAVCPLPIGLSYETIYVVMGGNSLAVGNFTGIRLLANGKIIMQYRTGAEADSFNQFNGRAAATTARVLMIDMVRFHQKTKEAIEVTKLGTGRPPDLNQTIADSSGQQVRNPNYNPYPVQTMQLEIDFNATAGGTLTIFAKQSAAAVTGLIRKVRPITYTPAGTSFELADLPKGDLIDKVFLPVTGPKITNVKLLKDQVTQFDRTNTLNTAIQTDGKFRTPQSGLFVHDTTEEGFGTETVQTAGVNDLRYQITYSTTPTGQLTCTVDYLGHLDR